MDKGFHGIYMPEADDMKTSERITLDPKLPFQGKIKTQHVRIFFHQFSKFSAKPVIGIYF
jgi:hypothetical protein